MNYDEFLTTMIIYTEKSDSVAVTGLLKFILTLDFISTPPPPCGYSYTSYKSKVIGIIYDLYKICKLIFIYNVIYFFRRVPMRALSSRKNCFLDEKDICTYRK